MSKSIDESSKLRGPALDAKLLFDARRPAAPIVARSCGSFASLATASAHSAGVFAKKPVRPCSIIEQFMPTGFATIGRPAAMYAAL